MYNVEEILKNNNIEKKCLGSGSNSSLCEVNMNKMI